MTKFSKSLVKTALVLDQIDQCINKQHVSNWQ